MDKRLEKTNSSQNDAVRATEQRTTGDANNSGVTVLAASLTEVHKLQANRPVQKERLK